jgi:hypothetical protein
MSNATAQEIDYTANNLSWVNGPLYERNKALRERTERPIYRTRLSFPREPSCRRSLIRHTRIFARRPKHSATRNRSCRRSSQRWQMSAMSSRAPTHNFLLSALRRRSCERSLRNRSKTSITSKSESRKLRVQRVTRSSSLRTNSRRSRTRERPPGLQESDG